jgi:hypothetical protein
VSAPSVSCLDEGRREDVRRSPLLGIDFVEVDEAQTTLDVFFLGRAPAGLEAPNVVITGGSPVGVAWIDVFRFEKTDPAHDDWMQVRLDRPGDFSAYTLALQKTDERGRPTGEALDGLDPRYATAAFSFKVSCPTGLDCAEPCACPPPPRAQPQIDYLAKDYDSFRRLIFDRLAQTMPDWSEQHVPDVGVMLVELLAYVGDHLSYYQDAVATEAYLGTARQRISVRRHARLVDYAMHEGCNARAFVTVATDTDAKLDPEKLFFCTRLPGAPDTGALQPADVAKASLEHCVIFEPLLADPAQPIVLRAAHSEMRFYTWGDRECCLPVGTTRATLADAWVAAPGSKTPGRALQLAVDDVLIFEEAVGPATGIAGDADRSHRQAVRLTKVTPAVDPLYDTEHGGRPVVDVEWCSEDALTFALCISARMLAPDCSYRDGISVARGNVVLVDSGTTVGETLGAVPAEQSVTTCATDCEPATVITTPGPFRPALRQTPLTFAQDLPPYACAGALTAQDPRAALPRLVLTGVADTPHGARTTRWTARADLLESGPDDAAFVAEIDDAGDAHLRFGNGTAGRIPEAGTAFAARYRVGNGPDGNVGAETIAHVVFRETIAGIGTLAPRNPFAARGGTAPEPVSEVRLFAPYAFKDVMERAITAGDYAALAADDVRRLAQRPRGLGERDDERRAFPTARPLDDPRAALEEEPGDAPFRDITRVPFRGLQGTAAALRWTGSWYEADVALDPLGALGVDDELSGEVAAYLEPYRRIGHDLAVQPARYVALDVGIAVCVAGHAQRGHVRSQLLELLSSRVRRDGTKGMFHPDNLGFGQGVYASRIVAAAQAVPGVVEVDLLRLARFAVGAAAPVLPAPNAEPFAAQRDVPRGGALRMGAFEIARLDNDPSAPGHGRLTLLMRGGR